MFALIRTRFLVSVAYLVAISLAAIAESAYGQFDEPPAPPAAIVEAEVVDAKTVDAPPALEMAPALEVTPTLKEPTVPGDAPPAPSFAREGVATPKRHQVLPQRIKQSRAVASKAKPLVRKLHPTYMTRLVRSRQAEMPVTAPTIRANVVAPTVAVTKSLASQVQAKPQEVGNSEIEVAATTPTPALQVADKEAVVADAARDATETDDNTTTELADSKPLEQASLSEIRELNEIGGLPIVRTKAELKSVATRSSESQAEEDAACTTDEASVDTGNLQSVLVNKPNGPPIIQVSYEQPITDVASEMAGEVMLETPITVPSPADQPSPETYIPTPQVEYATLDQNYSQPVAMPVVSQPVDGSTGCATIPSAGVIAPPTSCVDGSCGDCAAAPTFAAACDDGSCGGLLGGLCSGPSCASGFSGGCLASLTARTTNAMPLGSSVNAYLTAQIAEGNRARSVVYLYDFFDPSTEQRSQLNPAGRRKLAKLTSSGWNGLPIIVQPVANHPELSEARRAAVETYLVSQLGYSGSQVVLQEPDHMGLRGVEAEAMDRNRLQNTRTFGQLGGGGGQVGGAAGGQGQQGQGQQGQGQQGQGGGQR